MLIFSIEDSHCCYNIYARLIPRARLVFILIQYCRTFRQTCLIKYNHIYARITT